MPPEMVRRVLASAGPDLVLIGGQALAFWAGFYDVDPPEGLDPAVSRDVDFFTPDAANTGPLAAFARAIGGRSHVLPREALSALVGQAVAPAPGERSYNVDLLHQVVGLGRDEIERHAVEVTVPGSEGPLRVLHPLHVLLSRNANLHTLPGKQDDIGRKQFALAIGVARAYLEDRIASIAALHGLSERQRERQVLSAIHRVIELSNEDAASKNAQRHGLHLADAIPAWRINSAAFWEQQWPHLRERMSPAHAAECERRSAFRLG